MPDLVLITGATGYIGSHIARKLLEEGFRIRVAARKVSSSPKVEQFRKTFAEFDGKFEFIEADLLDKSVDWSQLAKGCQYVMHVASSFPENVPNNEAEANVILQTAVDGTKAVVEGVAKEKSVKKLVITSSIAAITGLVGTKGHLYSEEDWYNTDTAPFAMTYEKSKTLAEKAAWEMHKKLENPHFSLVVVNPAVVLGPIDSAHGTSITAIKMLFTGELSPIPKVQFPIVDVRDVAAVHVKALTNSSVDNQRVIAYSTTIPLLRVSQILQENFGKFGYSLPQRTGPDWLFKLISCFSAGVRPLASALGKESVFDNSRMRTSLGIEPIPVEKTLVDTGHSMIKAGIVNKTPQYEAANK